MAEISFRTLLLTFFVVLCGCVVTPKPYEPPVDIPLQDPPEGQAIVYLLRSPYDNATVAVSLLDKPLAVLPASTYTAVVLSSGRHVLLTRQSAIFGEGTDVAAPTELALKPNERRFFNLSGATARTMSFAGAMPMPGGGFIPLVTQSLNTKSATRAWKEVTELDAQGLDVHCQSGVARERGPLKGWFGCDPHTVSPNWRQRHAKT